MLSERLRGAVHIAGGVRSQLLLLLDSIDDYVGPPARLHFHWCLAPHPLPIPFPQCGAASSLAAPVLARLATDLRGPPVRPVQMPPATIVAAPFLAANRNGPYDCHDPGCRYSTTARPRERPARAREPSFPRAFRCVLVRADHLDREERSRSDRGVARVPIALSPWVANCWQLRGRFDRHGRDVHGRCRRSRARGARPTPAGCRGGQRFPRWRVSCLCRLTSILKNRFWSGSGGRSNRHFG